ncbi:MAG TPA: hypothetical protein VFO36_08855, partial [Nitrospiraceae bacterium]|nr:hypothetical protein [Nitrospiraceae bacterium]
LNIVITTIGCDYVIHMTSGTSGGTFHGDMDVVCAGAATISVVAGTCEMKIGGQSGLTNIMTTNNTTGTDSVTLEAELSGIAVTKVKDGFLCPLSGTGATTGSYNGDIVAKGFNGGTQVDITFD